MSNLISGKKVLLALATGDCVMCRNESSGHVTDAKYQSVENILHGGYEYRGEFISLEFFIKPETILLNDVEIPAPFEPKEGDAIWFINSDSYCGYSDGDYDSAEHFCQFGAWRTEDEIKQVVKELKNIFKGE